MELDTAPLEAAFLKNVARGRVGDARARIQIFLFTLFEEEVDHGARGFGTETLAPMLDAEPVAELGRVRLLPIDADHADRNEIAFDQERDLARIDGGRAHEIHRVVVRIGMRQPAGIFRDAPVVGETHERFYVRERRPAQRQPFSLEDARTGLAPGWTRNILQHVEGSWTWAVKAPRQSKRGRQCPASPLEPRCAPPVHQDPADSYFPPSIRPQLPSLGAPIRACGHWLWHETRHAPRSSRTRCDRSPSRH